MKCSPFKATLTIQPEEEQTPETQKVIINDMEVEIPVKKQTVSQETKAELVVNGAAKGNCNFMITSLGETLECSMPEESVKSIEDFENSLLAKFGEYCAIK